MKALYNRKKEVLALDDSIYVVTNRVRNELNGLRKLGIKKEVVRSVNKDRSPGVPYMPRQFPVGKWSIIAVEVNKDSPYLSYPGFTAATFDKLEFGEVRIRTDAHQSVGEWSLDENVGYKAETGKMVDDYGYHFHYSVYNTTLGCGRFVSQNDCIEAAKIIASHLAKQGPVCLEVV